MENKTGYNPETIRAKFKCIEISMNEHNSNATLSAVTTGSEENKSFSEYTPNATLNITISKNTEAHKFFEPGREYYLDFTECNE